MKKLLVITPLFLLGAFAEAQPTWADDIACIVYSHCSGCHTPGGIAPFTLMSYADAYANRFAMQASIETGSMPPWPPDQSYNPMAHANVLSDEEIEVFGQWVMAGAPEGDPANAPSPPEVNTTAEITNPDLTVAIPDFTIPASSGDKYKCFVIPTNEGQDRHITAMEIIPGNRGVVHHVLVFQDITDNPINADNNDPAPGYTCFGDPGSQDAELMSGWAPGATPRYTPPGMGIPLPNQTNLIVQIHYPEGSEGQVDSTRINFKFADIGTPIRDIYNYPVLNHYSLTNGPLHIPANEVRSFHSQFSLPINASGIGVAPHAHLICKSMRAYAVLPNGTQIPLIDIPNWDFSWQGFYDFPSPVVLPQGTVIHGEATYDNTASNPNNPNNPPQDVWVGEATTDEMLVFYVSFLPYVSGDENLVIDDPSEHTDHHDNCSSAVVSDSDIFLMDDFRVFPNPVHTGHFNLEIPEGLLDYQVEITDLTGKAVLTEDCVGDCAIMFPDNIPNGLYFARLVKNGAPVSQAGKVVLMR